MMQGNANADTLNLDGSSAICLDCAGADQFIKAKLEQRTSSICCICGSQSPALRVLEIAAMVAGVFEKYVTRQDTFAQADSPEELIQHGILECDRSELAEAVLRSMNHQLGKNRRPDEPANSYDNGYEAYKLQIPSAEHYQGKWEVFVKRVRHVSRFYNRAQHEMLDEIMRPLLDGSLIIDTPHIIEIGPSTNFSHIYRARAANSQSDLRRIYSNPTRELSPPPPRLRMPGRMNALGVRAFYGCVDPDTTVAELRVPVGGGAVVGKFRLLKRIRVLDLRTLDQRPLMRGLSWFDPNLSEKVRHARFVRDLHDLIRNPVIPEAEPIEYLTTQFFAEYLGQHGIGGVIFLSSLVSHKEASGCKGKRRNQREAVPDTGVNIVLFSNASVVAGCLSLPRRKVIELFDPFGIDGLLEQTQTVTTSMVEVPAEEAEAAFNAEYAEWEDALEPSLQLEEDSLSYLRVRGINYDIDSSRVEIRDKNQTE